MTAAFHEVLFPLDIALKSAGGPERKTEIVALGSGRDGNGRIRPHQLEVSVEKFCAY